LQSILGIVEESRARISAALWQYIKSNRLQDPEERRFVNLNSELQKVFGAEERIEFHKMVHMLKPHLLEVKPLTISVSID
jgi:SWI/SNF-related matrix-associated actin-dependent regulator of chromatin subfamily D